MATVLLPPLPEWMSSIEAAESPGVGLGESPLLGRMQEEYDLVEMSLQMDRLNHKLQSATYALSQSEKRVAELERENEAQRLKLSCLSEQRVLQLEEDNEVQRKKLVSMSGVVRAVAGVDMYDDTEMAPDEAVDLAIGSLKKQVECLEDERQSFFQRISGLEEDLSAARCQPNLVEVARRSSSRSFEPNQDRQPSDLSSAEETSFANETLNRVLFRGSSLVTMLYEASESLEEERELFRNKAKAAVQELYELYKQASQAPDTHQLMALNDLMGHQRPSQFVEDYQQAKESKMADPLDLVTDLRQGWMEMNAPTKGGLKTMASDLLMEWEQLKMSVQPDDQPEGRRYST